MKHAQRLWRVWRHAAWDCMPTPGKRVLCGLWAVIASLVATSALLWVLVIVLQFTVKPGDEAFYVYLVVIIGAATALPWYGTLRDWLRVD